MYNNVTPLSDGYAIKQTMLRHKMFVTPENVLYLLFSQVMFAFADESVVAMLLFYGSW